MVEENVDHTDVIATGSPMERGLGMAAGKLRVDIGTGRNQLCYGLSIIREMAGPVRGYVEQRTLIVDPGIRKIGVLPQEPLQCLSVPAGDCLNGCRGPLQ